MRYVHIEGVRSQSQNTSPSSKLFDDELVKLQADFRTTTDKITNASPNLILEWKTDSVTTRNQIPTNLRKKGLVISYKDPNIIENGGWITEQYIAADVPTNTLWGYSERWSKWDYQKQINYIKSDLAYDYKVTYNSNFGTMLMAVPKDIRKQFLVVAYTDNNGNLVRIIRKTPFNQTTDGDTGWYASTAWETLVSRGEFSEVQKNVLLMSKTNFVCNILNNSPTGDFNKVTNTLYFSSSTNPTQSKGLNVSFGIGNKDAIDRMNLLYKIGVKPSIQMTIEESNISTLKGMYFYNTKGQSTTAPFQSKNIAGKTVYYADDLDIPDNLWYILFYLYSNVKTTSGEASLRILSADIYYPNEMHNNYFINGDGENLIESHIIFDTDYDTGTNKYCKIIDDRTALITVPKGTNLGARDIVIPLKSFPKPLSFGSIGEKKLIRFKSNGDSSFGDLNFADISAEINAKLIDISKFSNPISFKDSEVLYLSELQNTNNYYGQYAYNKVAIRCGLTPNVVLEEDFICIIQADILDFKQADNLNGELDRIRTDLSDMKKSIGTYSANFHNPYCGIVGKSENVILSDKNTIKIDNGISENGEYVDLLIAASRVRSHNIEEPEYSVQFITNKTTKDSIGITADVLSETNIKIQSATVSYDEIYNGIVTVNFKLLKQTSDIRYIKLRCTFTTSLSEGISLSISDCSVKNLSKSSSIADTIYNLQYGNRPIIIQSQNGKKFRLVISEDGTLSTAPSVPSKMMVMSHSWGLIPYNPSQGWYGNWGMAASEESLDMINQIETQGKSFNPEFSSFYYRFATFATNFKNGASWFKQFDCSNLDFDSIFICCFAAGPIDGDWTGFAEALYDCVTNYVCKGKSNIPVYIGYGGGDRAEIEKAAGLFGTQLIDTSDAYSSDGRGWPWLMPAKPDGSQPIKAMELPEGANAEDYILNGQLTHPGNWGFYSVAKKLSNQIHKDFSIQNDNPIVKDFNTYKKQP